MVNVAKTKVLRRVHTLPHLITSDFVGKTEEKAPILGIHLWCDLKHDLDDGTWYGRATETSNAEVWPNDGYTTNDPPHDHTRHADEPIFSPPAYGAIGGAGTSPEYYYQDGHTAGTSINPSFQHQYGNNTSQWSYYSADPARATRMISEPMDGPFWPWIRQHPQMQDFRQSTVNSTLQNPLLDRGVYSPFDPSLAITAAQGFPSPGQEDEAPPLRPVGDNDFISPSEPLPAVGLELRDDFGYQNQNQQGHNNDYEKANQSGSLEHDWDAVGRQDQSTPSAGALFGPSAAMDHSGPSQSARSPDNPSYGSYTQHNATPVGYDNHIRVVAPPQSNSGVILDVNSSEISHDTSFLRFNNENSSQGTLSRRPGSNRSRRSGNSNTPGPSKPKSKCDECHEMFVDVRSHKRNTHGERNQHCHIDDCDKRFRTRSDLTRHKRTVHDPLSHYSCPYCSSKFPREDNMRRHVDNQHSEMVNHLVSDGGDAVALDLMFCFLTLFFQNVFVPPMMCGITAAALQWCEYLGKSSGYL
ncbi:hypothetical protein EJ08DRAFT_664612 [Tothia fuscella]|uniref:C2H2-type domain-containing protein n=1 Tax=Tothia fuscella TaxID=1048955 RepID=A0A9P4NJ02_9PEZI|nr:hypothetical protein EJ08DRAFT_664612 [Tothia fuscella]